MKTASVKSQHSDVRTVNSAQGTPPLHTETMQSSKVVVWKTLQKKNEAGTGQRNNSVYREEVGEDRLQWGLRKNKKCRAVKPVHKSSDSDSSIFKTSDSDSFIKAQYVLTLYRRSVPVLYKDSVRTAL
jgi:hypothetical protein